MKKPVLWVLLVLVLGPLTAIFGASACGDSSEDCPGTICTNCSASGDCPNPSCAPDQSLFCVGFPFGESDADQRCTFCEDPDFELP